MAKYRITPSSKAIIQLPISIGHKAEKGVEAIEFDVTAWVETYGSGTLTVIMRRWGDAIPYPIALEIDENNKATWTLSDTDTAKAGMAYAQLNYIVGDEVVKKSDIYTFRVMDSLTGEGDPPEAYESWLEHLTHLAAEAMAEVLDIEGIVTDKTLTVDGGIADAKATGEALAEKVDAADYRELSDRVGRNTIALAEKADRSTTYTKTQVDQMISDVEVETDTTLEIAGAPADAAETGRQIGLLKADLDAQKSGKMFISGDFSHGVFNSSNMPEADPRKFNAVMMDAEHYDRDIIVSAKTGYNFLAYFYDSNDVYVRKTANWGTSVSVPAGSYFRLWVRENPLDTSVVIDLETVKENIVFDTELHDEVLQKADDVEKCILNTDLNGEGKKLINTTFVWGKMNTSTGEAQIDTYKYQVVMPNSVVYDHDVIIKCNAGYRYQVWWYDANDAYISRTGGFKTSDEEYTVSAGTYFRLFVTLDPPNTSAVVDPSVFAKNVFIVTQLGKRVKNIEENTLSTLPPYILNTMSYKPLGMLSKGYMLMSCDDGTEGLATYTIPMLINKGVPCTFGLLSSSAVITNETYLAIVVDAVTNHNCCVALHGSAQWTTYTEKELADYLEGLKDTLDTAGITRISGSICPGGNSADTSRLVQAVAGGLCGAVFSGNRIDKIAYGSYKANGCRTNMYDLDRYSAISFTASTYQSAIDDAYDNHYVLAPFWHDYSIVNDSAKQAIIEGMIDYALTKGLTFITMSDLANIT